MKTPTISKQCVGAERRHRNVVIAAAVIFVAAVAIYLQPVFDLGFYYDDWSLLAVMNGAPGEGFGARYEACRGYDPAGRFGNCLYHATANFAFGDHPYAYHVLSIALLALGALAVYALLSRCRLGLWPSLLSSLLFIIYPGSDSTRLWAGGLAGATVLAAYVGAVLLAIEGLRRVGRRAMAWHAASLAIFVLLLFTYEVVVPPIAVAGLFYVLAAPAGRRAALFRGAVDLGLAMTFTVFRLFIDPVSGSSGFVQGRTIDEWIKRLHALLEGAWISWRPLFLPGAMSTIIALVGTLIWVIAMVDDYDVRRESRRWLIAAAGAAGFAVIAVLAYLTANDLYVPDTSSLFNRLNLMAAPAYCVLFVALCGLLWTALVRWLPPFAAAAVLASAVVVVAVGQVKTELRSQEAWATSWDEQTAALGKLRALAPGLPRNASVMSFGHPIWERGFIPVFAAGWDLRGAILVETRINPPAALPFVDDAHCGTTGVLRGSEPYLPYRDSSPLWFVNLANGQARRIASTAQCQAAVIDWGRPPFWGKTITGSD